MKAIRSVPCISLLLAVCVLAAPQKGGNSKKPEPQRETVAKPLSAKEIRKREEKLRKELMTPYRKWLNEDVTYIITDEERAPSSACRTTKSASSSSSSSGCAAIRRRTRVENEFKEEHYRRIAYANERFASGIPGWKTDRGRIYITFGPADETESHPSGGTYQRPPEEGGGTTSTFPFEKLALSLDRRYRQRHHYRIRRSHHDGRVPHDHGPVRKGRAAVRARRRPHHDGADGPGRQSRPLQPHRWHASRHSLRRQTQRMNQFNRLEQFAKLQRAPAIKFKDLEAAVSTRITYNILPMKVRVDFFPITDTSVLTNITVQFENKDLQFQAKEGVQKAVVNIFGKITTMTRRSAVNPFEETVTVDAPTEMLQAYAQQKRVYQKVIPLAPGTYRLNVVAKDVVGGNMSIYEKAITVPRLDSEKMASSTLVLADVIESVPARSIGTGMFVIGSWKVRPRVGEVFKRDEKLGIFLKLYNFTPDDITNKPSGQVQYEIVQERQ